MEKPNIQSQGMLKMLQDLYDLLKVERQETSYKIFNRVGMDQKYWKKLVEGSVIINVNKLRNNPIYRWNTIKPNIYMAEEVLGDTPKYNNARVMKLESVNDASEHIEKAIQDGAIFKCLNCGRFFNPERSTAKYCGELCRKQYNRVKAKHENIIPPKLEWVKAYCEERKNGIDPEHFMKYYNNAGWKVKQSGKRTPMNNWKMAITTWERNQKRPITFMQVPDISKTSDNELISELKKRGYSGNINKKMEF